MFSRVHASSGHHGGNGNESPFAKFLINGTVAWTFELCGGHYLEFLKIAKQTSGLSYIEITKRMVQHKGLIGVLDGYFPWGSIQCFVKGASFGFGQAWGRSALEGHVSHNVAEILSGGIGGGVQGVVMSPLLLLKTRVMTDPTFRSSGGVWETTVASTKVGMRVVQREGVTALMKGSMVFSSKRVADWTTRYFFAEVMTEAIQRMKATEQIPRPKLNIWESSFASFMGGALSATVTIPMDVLVATFQDASKAGQKMSVIGIWREQLKAGGMKELVQYSCRGYVARVTHVALTTVMMKTISSQFYALYNRV